MTTEASKNPSNQALIARLREGEPGHYEFTLRQGDSYEQLEEMMAEARDLAARFGGTFRHVEGTLARPDGFVVNVPVQPIRSLS